jgi:glucose/arabinose dehydrogenase
MICACSETSRSLSPQVNGLVAPPGFKVSVFASGLDHPRMLSIGPDSEAYVSEMGAGRVTRLPDRDHDGRADRSETIAESLNEPHGLAFLGRRLYVAENQRVIRVTIPSGSGAGESLTVVVPDLPAGGGHFTRTLAIDPGARNLFVSIGSTCNVCVEDDPRRASVMRFALDGTQGEVFAHGLRNAVGLAFRPGSDELWATENGRDMLGDDMPPEEIVNILEEGGDYGWPYCYGDRIADPTEGGTEEHCAATIPPALTDSAHVAPLGCAFYTGTTFPPEYDGEFFVCCHGSWNRSVPAGYKVLRVHVEGGRPTRAETFLGGFRRAGVVHGRPVGVCTAADGSLLVTDDFAGVVYRVTYIGSRAPGRR